MLKRLTFFLVILLQGYAANWTALDSPFPHQIDGAFVGCVKNHIFVVGGKKEEEFSSSLYLIECKEGSFERVVKQIDNFLPEALAFGAAVESENGLFCIGGIGKSGISDQVYFIQFDSLKGSLRLQILPPLPFPLAYASGGLIDHKVYLVGGLFSEAPIRPNPYYLSLSLDFLAGHNWKVDGYFPSTPRIAPAVSVQSNGLEYCLYVFGGKALGKTPESKPDAFCFDPTLKKWSVISSLDHLKGGNLTAAVGSNAILAASDAFYLYNTVTDRWHFFSELPMGESQETSLLENSGELFLFSPSKKDALWRSDINTIQNHSKMNYPLLAVYVLVLLVIAYFFSKRKVSSDDYFKGGYRVPWWAAGLSIFGTVVNSLYFMVSPAKAFVSDWQYLLLEMTLILVAPVIIYGFIPFYRRLSVSTAYEYLEKRFDYSIRLLGSSIFIIFEVLRIGIYLYLPALVLSILTGLSMSCCIICMGVLSVIYVSLGGIEAVIWSDILQVAVLIGGAAFTFCYIIYHYRDDLGQFYQIAISEQKTRIFDFSFDFSRPTFWVILLAGISFDVMDYGTDQITVQRYLTTKDESSAAKSLWLNVILCLAGGLIFFALGTALFAIYKVYPEKINPTMPIIDGLLPSFIVTELPETVSGLLMTGIFVAAMSSIHSGINGISSAITNDFLRPLLQRGNDARVLTLAKLSTATVGMIGIFSAVAMTKLKIISLLDHYITVVGFTLCGLSGIFLLGIFTTRAHKKGILSGVVLTLFSSFAAQRYTNLHSLMHMFVSTAGVFIFGYFSSLFIPTKAKNTEEFTIYHIIRYSKQKQTEL